MKKAIVIGGTTGIGKGIVDLLIAENYQVFTTGIEINLIDNLKKTKPQNLDVQFLDCTKLDYISLQIEQFIKKLGGLDLLILSAGIGNLNKNLGFPVENQANKLNVLAFTEIVDWSYRFFEKQNYGHLVAITSISGLFGSEISPAYHAAKSYQITYLEGVRKKARKARKLGKYIYITDIRPGFVATPMTQGKKMFWVGTQTKVAKQILKLIN